MLSRNFTLQKVGDLKWIQNNYDFNAIASSIDELVVLNVDREEKKSQKFSSVITELSRSCFIPLAAGGGINAIEDAFNILNAGADKLVLNSQFFFNKDLVKEIANTFGRQCVVCSLDYKIINGAMKIYTKNGKIEIESSIEEIIKNAYALGAGEFYLTSIAKDGTGQGLDCKYLEEFSLQTNLPVIASGGIGNYNQMKVGFDLKSIDAVSTANLFYFMEDGLIEARQFLIDNNVKLASWK